MKDYKFEAVIKESEIGKGGAYVEFPYNVEQEFDVKGQVKIICYFDGTEYQGSLVKMKTDCHIIGVTKDIRKKINKDINDTVQVWLFKDINERVVKVHPLFKTEMEKDPELKNKYERLSYTNKKEINNLLFDAKKEETLIRRFEKIISGLKK